MWADSRSARAISRQTLKTVSVNSRRSTLQSMTEGCTQHPRSVWIEMPEQQVPFKLENSRVYHEGMTFSVKNVVLKTRGSVGTDNTLNLVPDVPIKDEWLGDAKVLAGLKGKTISIPISGTTSRP